MRSWVELAVQILTRNGVRLYGSLECVCTTHSFVVSKQLQNARSQSPQVYLDGVEERGPGQASCGEDPEHAYAISNSGDVTIAETVIAVEYGASKLASKDMHTID